MTDATSVSADYLRGCQLLELKHYADAEAAFRRVLTREPNHAWALHQLAWTLWRQNRETEALTVIRQAIGADPEESAHQVLQAHVLCSLNQLEAALTAAGEALALDPASAEAFTARAEALSAQGKWAESEAAAREALALDAEHALAHHFLAHTLRKQGHTQENAAVVSAQLRRDPDSPLAHANAGWAALERGERRQAEEHFREALRLAPELDWAREGLLQSFRARSPVYRTYLAYTFWMEKRRAGQQWAIIFGLWLGIRFARVLLTGHLRWLGVALGFAYLAFVFWVWVARGVGNLLLLNDPFARLVLRRHEKLEAVFVGGGLLTGLGLAVTGFALRQNFLLLAGFMWAMAAIPLACTFDNTRQLGRWLFGTIGATAWAIALAALALPILPDPVATRVATIVMDTWPMVLIACALTSWIGNLSALHQRR